MYRPGDTAHLVAIVRDRAARAPTAKLPVALRLTDPRERTLRQIQTQTNEAGAVTLDWSIPAFADTGSYTLTALVADKPVGDLPFHVEEFVPERMKVQVTPLTPQLLSGEFGKVKVQAKYLFGATPAGAKVELTCRIEPAAFTPKENANFTYGVWHAGGKAPKPLTLGNASGELDKGGDASLTCPGQGGFEEPARLVATAAVFESGSGRTSVASTTSRCTRTSSTWASPAARRRPTKGKPIQVAGVVIDWTGALSEAVSTVELRFVRLEEDYGWSYDEDEGRDEFQRYLRPITEAKASATVQHGKFTATFTPQDDGEAFLVEARAGKARTDLELKGNGRWWWEPGESRAEQTPRPQKPSLDPAGDRRADPRRRGGAGQGQAARTRAARSSRWRPTT